MKTQDKPRTWTLQFPLLAAKSRGHVGRIRNISRRSFHHTIDRRRHHSLPPSILLSPHYPLPAQVCASIIQSTSNILRHLLRNGVVMEAVDLCPPVSTTSTVSSSVMQLSAVKSAPSLTPSHHPCSVCNLVCCPRHVLGFSGASLALHSSNTNVHNMISISARWQSTPFPVAADSSLLSGFRSNGLLAVAMSVVASCPQTQNMQ